MIPACFFACGSVRAPTQYQSAKWADVVQVFCPLSFQPPGALSARSCIDAASEPEFGSL